MLCVTHEIFALLLEDLGILGGTGGLKGLRDDEYLEDGLQTGLLAGEEHAAAVGLSGIAKQNSEGEDLSVSHCI